MEVLKRRHTKLARLQDAIDELRTQWDDNITDPNTSRRQDGNPWIFQDEPQANAQKPRIGPIREISAPYEPLGLGTTFSEQGRIQARVTVNIKQEYDVTGDVELETAEDTLNYIITQMVETVLSNQSTINSNAGTLWVQPLDKGDRRKDGKNLTQTVDFRAVTVRNA